MKKQDSNDDPGKKTGNGSSDAGKMPRNLNGKDLDDLGPYALEICESQEDIDYLTFLIKLAGDVVTDPAAARRFSENPDGYVGECGYNRKVNMDDGLLKLILALGDEEINRAISQNDVERAVEIMESKGLLEDLGNVRISVPEETIRNLYADLGITDVDTGKIGLVSTVSILLTMILVLVTAGVFAAALVQVAAAVETVLALEALVEIAVAGASPASPAELKRILSRNLPLRVWSLKGDATGGYIATNTYINNQVDKIIDMIKKRRPEIFERIDEQKLRRLIICNITKTIQ